MIECFKNSLACRDCELVKLRLLRPVRRVKSKFLTLDFRKSNSGLSKDVLGKVPVTF